MDSQNQECLRIKKEFSECVKNHQTSLDCLNLALFKCYNDRKYEYLRVKESSRAQLEPEWSKILCCLFTAS